MRLHIHSSTESQRLNTFLSQSKQLPKYKNGGNRFDARKQVSLDSSSADWVSQDVNMLFKTRDYLFSVPVHGATDDYTVTIKVINFLDRINKALETKQFSVPTFQQELMNAMNNNEMQVSCTCPDQRYRFAHSLTLSDDNSGRPETRPSPITNPTNQKGCCKHIIYTLSRKLWATKVARALFNYIVDIWKNKKVLFDKIIRPALNDITDEKILSKPEKPKEQPLEPEQAQDQPEQSADTQNDAAKESLSGNATDDEQIKEAIEVFGLTTRMSLAGFILPDGQMLDFSGGSGRRVLDHRDIADIYDTDELDYDTSSDYLAKFMRDTGSIRVDYNSCSIDIDTHNMPTWAQLDRIEDFILPLGDCYLEFSDGVNTQKSYSLSGRSCNAKRIVNIITHFFTTREFIDDKSSTEAINSYYDGKQVFDEDQLLMLSVCKDMGADVEPFVTPENTPEQILEIGEAYKKGVPVEVIRELTDPLLSYKTIQVIAQSGMYKKLLPYKNFSPDALEQIVRGVKLGVPIEKIALRGFNYKQIEQLVRAYRISESLYNKICDRGISYNKMRDIIAGRN